MTHHSTNHCPVGTATLPIQFYVDVCNCHQRYDGFEAMLPGHKANRVVMGVHVAQLIFSMTWCSYWIGIHARSYDMVGPVQFLAVPVVTQVIANITSSYGFYQTYMYRRIHLLVRFQQVSIVATGLEILYVAGLLFSHHTDCVETGWKTHIIMLAVIGTGVHGFFAVWMYYGRAVYQVMLAASECCSAPPSFVSPDAACLPAWLRQDDSPTMVEDILNTVRYPRWVRWLMFFFLWLVGSALITTYMLMGTPSEVACYATRTRLPAHQLGNATRLSLQGGKWGALALGVPLMVCSVAALVARASMSQPTELPGARRRGARRQHSSGSSVREQYGRGGLHRAARLVAAWSYAVFKTALCVTAWIMFGTFAAPGHIMSDAQGWAACLLFMSVFHIVTQVPYVESRIRNVKARAEALIKDDAEQYSAAWKAICSNANNRPQLKATKKVCDAAIEYSSKQQTYEEQPEQPIPPEIKELQLSRYDIFVWLLGQAPALNEVVQELGAYWAQRGGATSTLGFKRAPVKTPKRAIEKIWRCYNGNPLLLSDIVRTSIVCSTVEQVVRVLSAIVRDPRVRIIRTKNRFDTRYNAVETAGYRDFGMNLQLVEGGGGGGGSCSQIFEVQIQLQGFYDLKTDTGHAKYAQYRDLRVV